MKDIEKVKPEIRVVGFDDCPFRFGQKEVVIIGAVFRGGDYLDGLISTKINVDGMDSTDKMVEAIKTSKHKGQIRVIILHGITFGGFNIVDIQKLSRKTGLPVIVVIGHKPDLTSIKRALKKFEDSKERLNLLSKAGPIMNTQIENRSIKSTVYYQVSGTNPKIAAKVIKATSTRSNIPEPLRAAHIICSGLRLP